MKRFTLDNDTVALYHFDEGCGNKAHSACGDPGLTLRAKHALWTTHPGGGSVACFERREDDAHVFVGPVNHDKLHLRTCTEAWTVEAFVRFTGEGGLENGSTYGNICGNDDEGFGLNGVRGGWNLSLKSAADGLTLKDGLGPGARFIGSLRGRDPNHDTSLFVFPDNYNNQKTWLGIPDELFIRDTGWHHVAWQFRYADQTHFMFIDGRLLFHIQLPPAGSKQGEVINDAQQVGVPFTVGGFVHSQQPPFFLGYGNFEGEIAELRISRVLRYPVAERLSIVKHRGRVADDFCLVAGLGLPFETVFETDAACGAVRWGIADGELPDGLTLDAATGLVFGVPTAVTEPRTVTLQATDYAGDTDRHTVAFAVRPPRIVTESLPPAFVGRPYDAALAVEYLSQPVSWECLQGELPAGLVLDMECGAVHGIPADAAVFSRATFRVRATDPQGVGVEQNLAIPVMPSALAAIGPDTHTVFLYDWQGPKARLVPDVTGDEALALDWTNMGGDRRVDWPGHDGRFPQETGHGEHGFASLAINHDKHNLRTCPNEWTVEAWVRGGGPLQCWGADEPFDYGHICGTYDTTEQGVWEIYISDHNSPDGSMAPGVHFLGVEPDQALKDLHPWTRPDGIVGDPADAGVRDTEWHHVAWQYRAEDDLHQLFLDGRLVWRMCSPDGRRLVNNRRHCAQFSVFTRINGYVIRGHDEGGAFSNHFNYRGWGNFFGQIGEIRVSDILRY